MVCAYCCKKTNIMFYYPKRSVILLIQGVAHHCHCHEPKHKRRRYARKERERKKKKEDRLRKIDAQHEPMLSTIERVR